MKEEINFTVVDIEDRFQNYINKKYLSQDLKDILIDKDILIVPEEGFRKRDIPVFPVKTEEVFNYLKKNKLNIEICIENEEYFELALHGDLRRLGKFVIKKVVLPVFISVLAAYVVNKIMKFDETTIVKIEIIAIDERNARKINFEGSGEQFIKLSNDIEKFWKEK